MSFRLPTRAILLALAVALLAVVAAGCGRDDDSSTGASAGGDTTGEQLSGTVIADGSSTVGPLTTAAAEAYREVQPDVNVEVGISGTGGGFERFCAGETDISERLPSDQGGRGGAALRRRRHRVHRVPGRRSTRSPSS